MANETILVVDDAPVSLKLADILLRKEGYEVYSTTDAEQALTLLDSLHPDLMLVDIQLPGMNGLELTTRVKQDSRTRDIVVVALTACAMKGDDDRAFEAGCDGYITKPIETLTLANKVREYLAAIGASGGRGRTGSRGAQRISRRDHLSPTELESLRRRFLEEGVQQCRQLLERLEGESSVPQSIRLTHGWVEAAHAPDYPVLAILAGEAEKLLRGRNPDRLLLCDALSNLMVGFVEPAEATIGPIPAPVEAALRGKSVALVGLADEEAERLCEALERASPGRGCSKPAANLPRTRSAVAAW
jgi:two-component system, cell cycle response regulator DivK